MFGRSAAVLYRCPALLTRCLSSDATAAMSSGPVQLTIQDKLMERFKPSHLTVVNESSMHNVPTGSETHFRVVVVSDDFEGLPLIKRHRLVMETLDTELKTGVHALSIQAKTPTQWKESGEKVEKSPPCMGGGGR